MRNWTKPRPPCRRSKASRLPVLLTILASPFLLTACGVRDRVVVLPVTPPPVAEQLVAKLGAPRCDLKPADVYPADRLEAERLCLKAAEVKARDRHTALSSAVVVREAAMAEVVKQHSAR